MSPVFTGTITGLPHPNVHGLHARVEKDVEYGLEDALGPHKHELVVVRGFVMGLSGKALAVVERTDGSLCLVSILDIRMLTPDHPQRAFLEGTKP